MQQPVHRVLAKAKRHARNGETAEAAKLYKAVLADFPNNARARSGLAALSGSGANPSRPAAGGRGLDQLVTLYAQRRLEETVALAESLAAAHPGEATIFNILGAANAGLGRLEAACDSFRRALRVDPTLPEGHFNLGIALKNSGDLPAAIASYRHAVQLNPAYAEAHYNLANALKAEGQPSAAIASYRRAISINPGYAKAHHNLANTLRTAGDLAAALDSYARALELAPDVAEIHLDLGNALAELRRYDDAIACYRKALEISPDNGEAKGLTGVALMRVGRQGEGLKMQDAGYGVIRFDAKAGVTLKPGESAA